MADAPCTCCLWPIGISASSYMETWTPSHTSAPMSHRLIKWRETPKVGTHRSMWPLLTDVVSQALSAYLFGSRGDAANLPLAREFEGAVMGDMSQRLQGVVAEHGAWLRSNCTRQVLHFVSPRSDTAVV